MRADVAVDMVVAVDEVVGAAVEEVGVDVDVNVDVALKGREPTKRKPQPQKKNNV